jgi:steroid delta-isomerase-like uncharacterized protein
MLESASSLTNLQTRREQTVRAHIEAENHHDIPAALATFHHPRYEVMPLGDAADGAEAVTGLLTALMNAFPDFHVDVTRLLHSTHCVVVELQMTGTHRGEWAGVAASGRRIQLMAACFFEFDADRLVCERVYFDQATLLRQIGALA